MPLGRPLNAHSRLVIVPAFQARMLSLHRLPVPVTAPVSTVVESPESREARLTRLAGALEAAGISNPQTRRILRKAMV